jgi:hypothetical protein
MAAATPPRRSRDGAGAGVAGRSAPHLLRDDVVYCLRTNEPELEVRRFQLDKVVTWHSLMLPEPEPSMPYEAYSLRGWLEGWLAS